VLQRKLKKSQTLLYVGFALLAIVIVASTVMVTSITTQKTTQYQTKGTDAYQMAMAGIERAKQEFNADPAWAGMDLDLDGQPDNDERFTLGDGQYWIWVDPASPVNEIIIHSYGWVDDAFRVIEVRLNAVTTTTPEPNPIWVGDEDANRVYQLNPSDGTRNFTAPDTYNRPVDMDIDSEGNCLLADYSNDRVYKLDASNGSRIWTSPNSYSNPRGVAVDQDDNYWVGDSSHNRVYKLSGSDGSRIFTAPDSYSYPWALDIDSDNNCWVGDSSNNRVYKLNGSDGTRIWTAPDTYSYPAALAVADEVTRSIVAYYPFEDSYADLSGNGNNGTPSGSVSFVNGEINRAVSVGGTNDYINLGSDPSLDLGNSFTIAAWINPSSLKNYAGIVCKDSGLQSQYSYMTVCHNNGRIGTYSPHEGWDWSSSAGISAGNWYHVAWVLESNTMYYYVNGQPQGSVSNWTYPDDPNDNTYVGSWYRWSTSYDFNGLIDDVRIYGQALSPDEINAIYRKQHDPLAFSVNSVAYIGDRSNNRVYKLDGSDGSRIWTSPNSYPYIYYHTLAVDAEDNGWVGDRWNNRVYKLNGSDGSRLFTAPDSYTDPRGVAVRVDRPTMESAMFDGLVAYYPFEDNWQDLSGQDNHGTPAGGAGFVDGKIGRAADFDGSGDHAGVDNFGSFDVMTVAAWVYRTGNTGTRESIVSYKEGTGVNQGFVLCLNENGSSQYSRIWVQVNGTWRMAEQAVAIPLNTWVHLVASYDGSTIRLYRDGMEVASANYSGSMTNTGSQMTGIGVRASLNTHWFPGQIDEVRIYNRALSLNEIRFLHSMMPICSNSYDDDRDGTVDALIEVVPADLTSGLIAHYPFEGNYADLTGNGHDGAPQGSPSFTGGISGQGISIGSGNYVSIADHAELTVPNGGAGAISLWFNLNVPLGNGMTSYNIFSKDIDSGSMHTFGFANGVPAIEVTGPWPRPDTLGSITSWAAGVWHHVVVSWNASGYSLYVDNILRDTSPSTVSILSSASRIFIGGTAYGGGYLDAVIDEVRIYDRVLTPEEIGELHSGAPITECNDGIDNDGDGTVDDCSIVVTPPDYSSGLVGEYHFEGNWQDSSPAGNHGTNNGASFNASGVVGQCGYFDGGNDYIDLGSDPSLDLGNSFTIAAWINQTQLKNYAGIVGKNWNRQGGWNYMAVYYNGRIRIYSPHEGWDDSNWVGMTTGTWYHVAWVLESNTMRFYIDGVPQGSSGNWTYPDSAANNVYIGSWYRWWSGYDFRGYIDEVKIWNRSLTAAEIDEIYDWENLGGASPCDPECGSQLDISERAHDSECSDALDNSEAPETTTPPAGGSTGEIIPGTYREVLDVSP